MALFRNGVGFAAPDPVIAKAAIAIASADLVVFYECACVWTATADEIVLGGAMYAGVINRPDDV